MSEIGTGQVQVKDTLSLPELEIKSAFNVDNGFKRVKIDSSILLPLIGADLSAVLSQYSTVTIKSNGNGTLSTPAFRGTTAQHTQVQWNGINLNSSMLGQIDLSQVPISQFDGLEVIYGPSGIFQTSGAFGGVIDLVTKPDWNARESFLISQKIGSFNTFGTNINIVTGTEDFQAHMKFNFNKSKNDFPFTMPNGETEKQNNASFLQAGVSQEMFWKIGNKHILSTKFWYSQDSRNVPPTTQNFNLSKTETLDDKSTRAVLEYKYVQSGWNLNARTMLNDQFMVYQNNSPEINSAHYSTAWINKIRLSYTQFKKMTIRVGIDYTLDRVKSNDYIKNIVTRNTLSVYAEVLHDLHKKVKTSVVLREDMVDGTFGTPIALLGIEYQPFDANIFLSANLSQNYKFPTLNDLYWALGGNPDLVPEYNYSMETGATYNSGNLFRKIFVELIGTAYYSKIYNMISWSPSSESSAIWIPENVDEIFNRGIEASLNVELIHNKWKFKSMNNYNFCLSTYEKINSPNDEKLGKQQIFIPVHTFNTALTIDWQNFYLRYNLVYTGERYTSKDNMNVMPGYALSNIIFGKLFKMNIINLSLQLDINNLFNLDYQSLPSKPMPGINQMLTIRVTFPGSR